MARRQPGLGRFRPQQRNANKHTARGMGMLDDSMARDGYVAPMTATADGEIIDGSARLEIAGERFAGVEPLVVEHDGTRPIIMVRTDIPDAGDVRAQRIALAANRVGQANLDFDAAIIAGMPMESRNILWTPDELAALEGKPRAKAEAEPFQCPRCGWTTGDG